MCTSFQAIILKSLFTLNIYRNFLFRLEYIFSLCVYNQENRELAIRSMASWRDKASL